MRSRCSRRLPRSASCSPIPSTHLYRHLSIDIRIALVSLARPSNIRTSQYPFICAYAGCTRAYELAQE